MHLPDTAHFFSFGKRKFRNLLKECFQRKPTKFKMEKKNQRSWKKIKNQIDHMVGELFLVVLS